MKLLSFGARLVDRLVPSVDAHAAGDCRLATVFCYCSNHKKYMRFCSVCVDGGGGCSACMATIIAC